MTQNNNTLLSLQAKQPFTYLLQNSHLQDHLSYVDEENSQLKGKVAYMIKLQQQQSMQNVNPFDYIKELSSPSTPFLNSEKFMKELERVRERVQSIDEVKKDKTKKNKLPQIDQQKLTKGKLTLENLRQSRLQINSSLINHEQSILKNIKIETGKQFSPMLLKQLIQSLQIEKKTLTDRIQKEKEEINQINRLRKYEQLQARQKEDIVEQRIKLMINKRRKRQ